MARRSYRTRIRTRRPKAQRQQGNANAELEPTEEEGKMLMPPGLQLKASGPVLDNGVVSPTAPGNQQIQHTVQRKTRPGTAGQRKTPSKEKIAHYEALVKQNKADFAKFRAKYGSFNGVPANLQAPVNRMISLATTVQGELNAATSGKSIPAKKKWINAFLRAMGHEKVKLYSAFLASQGKGGLRTDIPALARPNSNMPAEALLNEVAAIGGGRSANVFIGFVRSSWAARISGIGSFDVEGDKKAKRRIHGYRASKGDYHKNLRKDDSKYRGELNALPKKEKREVKREIERRTRKILKIKGNDQRHKNWDQATINRLQADIRNEILDEKKKVKGMKGPAKKLVDADKARPKDYAQIMRIKAKVAKFKARDYELFKRLEKKGQKSKDLDAIERSIDFLLAMQDAKLDPTKYKSSDKSKPNKPDKNPPSIQNLVETLKAQEELHKASKFLKHKSPKGGESSVLVKRPVRGQILDLNGGDLVPKKEARYMFRQTDSVDRFAVPHVHIQWYAIKRQKQNGKPDKAIRLKSERTNYIEVRDEGLLNDKTFNFKFDSPGKYEIHAIVNHSFYYPAHFKQEIEVKNESDRIKELEKKHGGKEFLADGKRKKIRFTDVANENLSVKILLGGVAGGIMATLGPGNKEEYGYRSEGKLKSKKVSFADTNKGLQDRINDLKTLKTYYSSPDKKSEKDILQLIEKRLAELNKTLKKIQGVQKKKGSKPIKSQGVYVSRTTGIPSGKLKVSTWFRYDAATGTYHGHLFDSSEIVRSDHFHLQASDKNYERMMQALFFQLTKTYPNGTMSFSFQKYSDHKTPEASYIRFERKTDTVLKDIKNVLFSQPVSIAVNLVSTILTVFPPTAPIGIGLSLAYNGADALMKYGEAARTGTTDASNYVDLGLVALDLIPAIGKGVKAIKVARAAKAVDAAVDTARAADKASKLTLYAAKVARAAEFAGNYYVMGDGVYKQIKDIHNKKMMALVALRREMAQKGNNPAEMKRLIQAEKKLVKEIRSAAREVITNAVATHALTITSQKAVGKLAENVRDRRKLATNTEPQMDLHTRNKGQAVDQGTKLDTHSKLKEGLPPALKDSVPIRQIPKDKAKQGDPTGDAVHVSFEVGLFGVKNLHIKAGPAATPRNIRDHVEVVKSLQRYQGIGGAIRTMMARIKGGKTPASRKFELDLEKRKLPAIIKRMKAEVAALKGKKDSEVDIKALQDKIKKHESDLQKYQQEWERLNARAKGKGYVASGDTTGSATLGRKALDGFDKMRDFGDASVRGPRYEQLMSAARAKPEKFKALGEVLHDNPRLAKALAEGDLPDGAFHQILNNEGVRKVFMANPRTPNLIRDKYKDWSENRRSPLKVDFEGYLGTLGYSTSTGRPKTKLEDLLGPGHTKDQLTSNNKGAQHALMATSEPNLVKALKDPGGKVTIDGDTHTLPAHIKTAVENAMKNATYSSTKWGEDARASLMSQVGDAIGKNIRTPAEFQTVMKIVGSHNAGGIGESFVRNNKAIFGTEGVKPSIRVGNLPKALRDKLSNSRSVRPDDLAKGRGAKDRRFVDIKTGYGPNTSSRIDLDQLVNYIKLMEASQAKNSAAQSNLKTELGRSSAGSSGKISGIDYIFLPGKGETSGLDAAKKAYTSIKNHALAGKHLSDIRIYYYNAKGKKVRYTP